MYLMKNTCSCSLGFFLSFFSRAKGSLGSPLSRLLDAALPLQGRDRKGGSRRDGFCRRRRRRQNNGWNKKRLFFVDIIHLLIFASLSPLIFVPPSQRPSYLFLPPSVCVCVRDASKR